MRFSVIIPVYNVELYLHECLDSVLAQTCGDWETVCVDDGSTDGSAAILAEYAARDSRFHIITQPNGGLSAARNTGLDHAKGDYILFLDSDDWLEHKALECINSQFSIFNSARFVCLTFDDGYRDNYTLAYPLLKSLGVPFSVYVTTGFIDNRLRMWWYPSEQLGITTDELKVLAADPLCTIGAHTVSHPRLDTLTREEQYKEISDSKQTLEKLLGHPIHHFSFPHGAHNDDTLAICRQLGFHTVSMAWGGPVRQGSILTLLPRISTIEP